MNERAIFLEALDKEDSTERSAFLDTVCAGDDALRQRVEALLKSHVEAGSFLGKLAPERVAEELAIRHTSDETLGETPKNGNVPEELDFLAPSDKPGSVGRLSHYEVQEVIGRGGMGIVLKAFDEKLHRVVAIKVMAAQLATNATARKRFAREAQAAAAVSHDHLVTIYAVEEADPRPYLVMQYVAGLSLQQRLDREGPLELPEILRIGMQTASALAAAHAQGLIHRDIKPANILLENGVERVKVTDFGLMRAFADASLTQEGVVAGTPQYMAPEQARGEAVDQRADLFSLGSVLYAMCTGRAPFRGSNSMSVLKRVCDETPTPIRETNSQIPDWLIAIIEQLHAKDPAQRYQSAAEVAALLGRHLAHVQHPAVVPLPSVSPALSHLGKGAGVEGKGRGRRRWAIAVAVIVLLVGGLSLTEATGVTNLRAAVIRIFTPDGTLVVEVDDPGVKVTIEGDGGLVITGAGLEEIRLRPGSYRIQADKDGKRIPLEREMVSIAKGGREVVKVKLEAAPAPASAKAEKGAFVLLDNGKDRKFDTLADSVLAASDGDTIEVRGNGPFISEPVNIGRTPLTIRAGEGFRPVIRLSAEGSRTSLYLLRTHAQLVLEGLDLQRVDQDPSQKTWTSILSSSNASLYLANCRLLLKGRNVAVGVAQPPVLELRNCVFLGAEGGTVWTDCRAGQKLSIENCVQARGGWSIIYSSIDVDNVSIRLARNSVVQLLGINPILRAEKTFPQSDRRAPPVRVEATANVFDCVFLMDFVQSQPKPLSAAEAEELLRQMLVWHGQRNLYAVDEPFLYLTVKEKRLAPATLIRSLANWSHFWGSAETNSIEGRVRFQGGNLGAKLLTAPEELTPDDFRLQPCSAGYRAGKDGKDLGADVDLVGPGKAYERWKKTPEYQQWLKDTGQVKK